MVFTSQGIHQAPTMVYPGCHGVLPITTIELLVALLHNSCCLLCASINSRLGVTCSCKSLAQCAHSAGWQGVGVGMLVRHCYWGGRRHLDCESARLATLHLPACLPPCITMKHILPCCNRIRATSYIANALVLLEILQHNHQTGEGGGQPAKLCTSLYFCLENVDSLVIVYKRGLPYITPFLYFLEK